MKDPSGTLKTHAASRTSFDPHSVRDEFPILQQQVHGHPLVYLDNAASTQRPRVVIDAIKKFYTEQNANVHRGLHTLSVRATEAYESARESMRRFINADSDREIVFTSGTTDGINLVAASWGAGNLREGDEILLTRMEHHSNIVPWQLVAERTGSKIVVADVKDDGTLDWEQFESLAGERTKVIAMSAISNATGSVNPIERVCQLARKIGAITVIDGAQASAHAIVDVQGWDCDFLALSGHKMFGPTGIGCLYGKMAHLSEMPPYRGGGEMILSVSFESTTYAEPPARFEAGTPNIAGAIGMAAAAEFLMGLDRRAIAEHERSLLEKVDAGLKAMPEIQRIGTDPHRASIASFVVDGVHAHDVGQMLDAEGIAVRVGHHCAEPLMHRFRVAATARASFALYNTHEEAFALLRGLKEVVRFFG